MTDKPIMIDGVDISGCEFYWREKELCNNGNLTSDCQENKDCLYKKYKHKEQEVQQAMDNYVQLDLQRVKEYNELINLYKAKEQECEELKEAIDSLLKIQYQLADSCTKYEQTLTEIKEIAENMNNECFYDDFDCMNCDMQNGCTYFNKKQILQKISECEVEDEQL